MRRLVAVALLFALALSGCEREKEQGVAERSGASDFTLRSIDGTEVSLSDFRGKVVLLEFFATWCPPCRMSVPDLNRLNAGLKDKDAVVLAVSVGERTETVREFVLEQGITYTVLVDDKGVDSSFGVSTIPMTFILDKSGAVVARHMGYMPGYADEMKKEIERLL